jgi:hypothetical protein
MPNRESLHELVDTLPEAALESAQRVLQNYQTWPPKPPIDVENMRRRVDELFRKRSEERAARTGKGVIASLFSRSNIRPDGDGSCSMSTWEGQTSVTLELRVFHGHRLEIEERLRPSEDKKSLLYALQIKGPEGKEGRYEIEFAVAEGPPPVGSGGLTPG